MSNLAVAQCHLIMSWTAEQHSSIFSTLTLKSSFIAACNDIRTFFLEHQIYTVFFCTLTQFNGSMLLPQDDLVQFSESINFKAEILISFCSFKYRKHRISLFSCNIWCGRKKSKHCVVSSKARNLVQATILMSLRFQTVYESFLYYLFTKFINT